MSQELLIDCFLHCTWRTCTGILCSLELDRAVGIIRILCLISHSRLSEEEKIIAGRLLLESNKRFNDIFVLCRIWKVICVVELEQCGIILHTRGLNLEINLSWCAQFFFLTWRNFPTEFAALHIGNIFPTKSIALYIVLSKI